LLNALSTVCIASVRIDPDQADFLSEQLPNKRETFYRLSQSGRLHILSLREVRSFLDFRIGVTQFFFISDMMLRHWIMGTDVLGHVISLVTSARDYRVTQSHIPEERTILYICLQNMNFGVH
jgi:hypothetical protein